MMGELVSTGRVGGETEGMGKRQRKEGRKGEKAGKRVGWKEGRGGRKK